MESFIETCYFCNGSGYVDYDLNNTNTPYEQNLIQEDCDNCSGKGVIKDIDAITHKIESINEMIYGFQQKAILHQIFDKGGGASRSKVMTRHTTPFHQSFG